MTPTRTSPDVSTPSEVATPFRRAEVTSSEIDSGRRGSPPGIFAIFILKTTIGCGVDDCRADGFADDGRADGFGNEVGTGCTVPAVAVAVAEAVFDDEAVSVLVESMLKDGSAIVAVATDVVDADTVESATLDDGTADEVAGIAVPF